MTGEMHKSEVTREAYPLHFAIADRLGGECKPFDQYQGPYVQTQHGKIWVCADDDSGFGFVYAEHFDAKSESFPLYEKDSDGLAAMYAEELVGTPHQD